MTNFWFVNSILTYNPQNVNSIHKKITVEYRFHSEFRNYLWCKLITVCILSDDFYFPAFSPYAYIILLFYKRHILIYSLCHVLHCTVIIDFAKVHSLVKKYTIFEMVVGAVAIFRREQIVFFLFVNQKKLNVSFGLCVPANNIRFFHNYFSFQNLFY